MTDQSTVSMFCNVLQHWYPSAQLGEPIHFLGVAYRNMGEGFLKGAEITQTA